MELRGSPYFKGGLAYLPLPKGDSVKACYYGGWVCSKECDTRACRELEESMPGHGWGSGISREIRKRLDQVWGNTP